MSAQNIISLGFNIEELAAEKQEVLKLFVDLFGKLHEFDGTRFNPLGGGGLGDLKKSINDGAKAMGEFIQIAGKYNTVVGEQVEKQKASRKATQDLTAEEKEHKKNLDGIIAAKAKYSQADTNAANDRAIEVQRLKQINAEVNVNAKAYLSQIGSINEAKATIAQLTIERNKQNAATKEGAAEILRLNAEIDKNNEFIKANSAALEKQKINIGNYSGAFKEAFGVLAGQLNGLKEGLAGLDANSPKFTQTTQQIELLERILGNVSQNFGSTRQELRAYQEAATQLGLAVGQTDDKFLLFNKAIGEVKNSINDIKAATAFQAQDAKVIVGLTSAVNGLVGAYGAASAAASLLGADEEDSQKQMAKFQQLLVLINGLQQVTNALQEESGAVQLILAAKTALLSASTKINTIVTSEAIATINAEAEANLALIDSYNVLILSEEENIAAVTGIIEANTEATAAALGTAGALEVEAGAAGTATAATTGFSSALIATGIGAVIVAIGAAVAFLVVKIREWMAATQLNAKQQKELNDALAAQVDALQKINDLQDAVGKKGIESLQRELDLQEKSGQSQYAILAIKQKIADKNAEIADAKYAQVLAMAENEYVSKGLTGVDALHKAQNDYFEDLTAKTYKASVVQKEYDAAISLTEQQRKKAGLSDKELERIKDRQAAAQSEQNLAQKNYDFFVKGEKDRTDAQHEQDNLRTDFAKLSADEQRKVIEEGKKREVDFIKFQNDQILNDEASTLDQRLIAIRSNARQSKAELEAERATILSTPSNFTNGKLNDEAKSQLENLTEQERKITLASQKEQEDIRRKYYERDRDAALASYRSLIGQQIKLAQDLQQGKVNNPNPLQPAPKVSLSDRLTGLSQEYEARRNLLNAELKVELDKEGQTAAEKKDIYDKYESDITDLYRDFRKTSADLEREAQEESLREWQLYYQKRKIEIDQNEIAQIRLLDDARQKDLISIRKYNRDKQKAEDEAALARAQTAANNAYLERNATKEGTKARADAEERLTEVVKGLNNQVTNNRIHGQDAQRDKVTNTLNDIEANYKNSTEAIGNILDIGFEAQKARLANLEALQEKNYEKGVKQVQDSTGTEEEKAARLKVLDSQRMAEKEANDRKLRQMEIERAQFEKAASITSIVLDTTKAIVGFLHNPGGFPGIALSVTAGILGSAQLAKAIATPVPHYKTGAGINGNPLHMGGKAVVGDGYEPELISEPGKRPYLSAAVPTMLDLAPMTSVVPISMLDDMSRMWVTDRGILSYQNDNSELSSKLDRLNNTMVWMAGSLKEAAKNNRPRVVVHNHIGQDLKNRAWAQKNVFD